MDIIQSGNNFLDVLYLKTKKNFEQGCETEIISELVGLNKTQEEDVVQYLIEKGLIHAMNGLRVNIKLSAYGKDIVLESRKNKTFKTIKFIDVKYLPSPIDGIEFLFSYNIIDEENKIESKKIKVSISGNLASSWGYQVWSEHPNKDYYSLKKILLQYGKEKIIEKLKEGTLTDNEELLLYTKDHPDTSPYNPNNLIELEDAEYEIEVGNKLLSEEVKENKLAASIIEARDNINAIFYSKHKAKLLLLNEERNLLDFFKSANTEVEYSHQVASLGQVSSEMNVDILRKLTNITDKQSGSVALLENFLLINNKPNKTITDNLKYIGKIRLGYPVHSDIAGALDGYKFFNLQYPIYDYENTWTTLLNYYLASLNQLREILIELYLKREG